jgi:molybdate transport system substrate-binding protein
MSRRRCIVTLSLAGLLGHAPPARAAELRVWAARAFATVLAEVGSEFTQASGHSLVVSSGLPNEFRRRADERERFDVLITVAAPLDEWIRSGLVVAATRAEIARSGIGVAVRSGSPAPDVRSVEAFKRALLAAKSIAYLRVGSGLYFHGLVERLGLAEAVASKAIRPETDSVGELVANGEAELGVVVITQILTTPGLAYAGPLPPELQSEIRFGGGVSARSRAPEAASRLLAFLKGKSAAAVIRAQGMEPIQD